MPDGEVAAGAGEIALRQRIAVRQKHRRGRAVGLDAHGIDGEHVGPVDEVGDPAEAFGLALGAIGPARAVEAGKGGVRVRIANGHDFKGEGLGRNRGDGERGFREGVVLRRQTLSVQREALQRQSFAIEHERAPPRRHFRVGPHLKLCGNARFDRIEREVEVHLLDEIGGGCIVFEQFGLASGLVHEIETIPSPSLLEAGGRHAKSCRQFFSKRAADVARKRRNGSKQD